MRFEKKRFVQFVASERFMKKLEKAKALLSNGGRDLSYETVLEAALDEFLKDHDPEERNKRREERVQKAEARAESGERTASEAVGSRAEGRNGGAGSGSVDGGDVSTVQAGHGQAEDPQCGYDRAGGGQADGPLFRRRAGGLSTTRFVSDRGTPRRIPDAVRDAVYARDKGRCTYVGSNGTRCASTHHLQIDHVIPRARGGTNASGNLRLLCERHNKKEAERVLGMDTLRRFRRRE